MDPTKLDSPLQISCTANSGRPENNQRLQELQQQRTQMETEKRTLELELDKLWMAAPPSALAASLAIYWSVISANVSRVSTWSLALCWFLLAGSFAAIVGSSYSSIKAHKAKIARIDLLSEGDTPGPSPAIQ